MSESHINHIDDKIKQAAENFLPADNELAWNRMEVLLDDERKKRRPVFWWWPIPVILLITFTILYLVLIQSSVNKEVIKKNTSTHPNSETKATANNSIIQNPKMISHSPGSQIKVDETMKNVATFTTKSNLENMPAPARLNFKNHPKIEKGKNIEKVGEDVSDVNDPTLLEINQTLNGRKDPFIESEPIDKENNKNDTLFESKVITLQEGALNQNKNSPLSKLYLTLTGGVEAPGLKAFSNSGSRISIKSGIGLGYQINKSFSLETGFFLGSKKYIAGPDNYKYPEDSYGNTVELVEVDANCLIYEIPLQVNYNVYHSNSLFINVGGGLQSFIMKKEKYIYDYLKNGSLYTYARSYKGNMHMLSSIKFSVGLEKNLNQKLSIVVTPAVSIPLSGVGNGKVKLHYTSIQAGIKYFPFQKNK